MTDVTFGSDKTELQDVCGGALNVAVNGVEMLLLRDGALWWAEKSLLVVSDLHLEKASSYARRGQMLPPYDTAATLALVEKLVLGLSPEQVISLGDSFHDPFAHKRLSDDAIRRIQLLTSHTDWCWVEGNHDPQPPEEFGGRAMHEIEIGPLHFRHEPISGGRKGEIAGHLHPCARVRGRSWRHVRAKCFAYSSSRLVMPSLGAFTGGLNVLDPAVDVLFEHNMLVAMLGRDGVYRVRHDSLAPDGSEPRRVGIKRLRRKRAG